MKRLKYLGGAKVERSATRGDSCGSGGVGDEDFVADMVLVKRQTKTVQGIEVEVLDFDNAIALEIKLSSGTNLTTPQGNALTKVKSSSNTFDIRSISKQSISDNFSLGNADNLKVNDFIKVWSDGKGGVINDVASMK